MIKVDPKYLIYTRLIPKVLGLSVFVLFFMVFFLSEFMYAQSYADQRFLDNSDQFDPKEGVRTRGPRDDQSEVRQNTVKPEIEVVKDTKKNPSVPKAPSKTGSGFSDIAKNLKSSGSKMGFSFSEMAKTTKKQASKPVAKDEDFPEDLQNYKGEIKTSKFVYPGNDQ